MLRMPRFGVVSPRSVRETLDVLAQHGSDARLLAGGTDLLVALKQRLDAPKTLVSLAAVEGLAEIAVQGGALELGARVTMTQLAEHPEVAKRAPALAQAAASVASPQIREVATLGGNLLLSTRCRYYNQSLFWRQSLGFCLKKDGTRCHVVEGGKKCVAAASSDTLPALLTLGASVMLESRRGTRTLPLWELYRADGIHNTVIEPDELLTTVSVPAPHRGHRGRYEKLRARGSIDYPQLGVAVRVDLQDEVVVDVDVVISALGARPRRVTRIESTLVGANPRHSQFASQVDAVAERAAAQCHPLPNLPGDAAYRKLMVPVFVRRALLGAVGGA